MSGLSVSKLATLVEECLTNLGLEQQFSEHTIRAYRTDLNAFVAWVEGGRVDDVASLQHRDFRRYLASLYARGYAKKTINRHLTSLRVFFRWLVREGYIEENAAAHLLSPQIDRVLPQIASDSALVSMIEQVDTDTPEGERDALMLELLYATGARISELAALCVDDVNLAQGEVRLFGKGRKERIVPLYQAACKRVAHYLKYARPALYQSAYQRQSSATIYQEHTALFVSVRGRPMSSDSLRKRFTICRDNAGLSAAITPHTVRHSFATELLGGGADLRSVQELLGHESLSTTQIYTHLSLKQMREAMLKAHPRA